MVIEKVKPPAAVNPPATPFSTFLSSESFIRPVLLIINKPTPAAVQDNDVIRAFFSLRTPFSQTRTYSVKLSISA